jgi:hypothetical protein
MSIPMMKELWVGFQNDYKKYPADFLDSGFSLERFRLELSEDIWKCRELFEESDRATDLVDKRNQVIRLDADS